MLKTVVKKGSYQDSVVLMLLTNELSSLDGVNKIQVMMATPANKDIFKESGLTTDELMDATANDMVVVADVNDEAVLDAVMDKVEEFLKKQSTAAEGKKGSESVKSWDAALKKMSNANLAVISIPGAYAALEADRALDEGLNVFMFSDNVTIEDEKALKEKAHSKGLAVMGPDCGTGIIQGVPIAFTNNVAKGSIGIIGASGTGIQELTTIIDRLGEGVTNAIGIGGRDLKAEVGGITMMDMIDAMEDDDTVKVLVIVSKPPAKEVRDQISARLSNFSKPVVTLFVGEKPEYHEENFYHAYTLDEAARLAVGLVRGTKVPEATVDVDESEFYKAEDGKTIKAYYSGGTLANEAAMLIKDAMNCKVPPEDVEGYMLQLDGNVVVDLGDDAYTQGKPHPMIDPAKRIECMQEAVDDPSTGVVLLDIMLGYGSHADMAGSLIPTIKELQAKADAAGRKVFFIATVCGTRRDYQGYDEAVNKLKEAGVIVCENNKLACQTAIHAIGRDFEEPEKEIRAKEVVACEKHTPAETLKELLSEKPRIINIGLKSFAEVVEEFDGALSARGARKAARFVEFCDAFNIPVLTLTNVSGFAATMCAERSLAKAAAKLTYAFANATVPKVNVVIGKAFGSAYVTMNSKSLGADMVYAWPTAEIGMMEADLAAKIMYADADAETINEKAKEYAELQSSPVSAARRGYVDTIIQPADTRKYVIGAFEMLFTKREERPSKKHGTI